MASDNTLQTLNDKLFAQLDRLDNRNADLMLRAAVARDEKLGSYQGALPKVLQSSDNNGKKNVQR